MKVRTSIFTFMIWSESTPAWPPPASVRVKYSLSSRDPLRGGPNWSTMVVQGRDVTGLPLVKRCVNFFPISGLNERVMCFWEGWKRKNMQKVSLLMAIKFLAKNISNAQVSTTLFLLNIDSTSVDDLIFKIRGPCQNPKDLSLNHIQSYIRLHLSQWTLCTETTVRTWAQFI